jgi:hypothetical protein
MRNHQQMDSYRRNLGLFKTLLGLNLFQYQLVLLWVQIFSALH